MTRKLPSVSLLLAVLASIGPSALIDHDDGEEPLDTSHPKPRAAPRLAVARVDDAPLIGVLAAEVAADITAPSEGVVKDIAARLEEPVREGQPLVVLDPTPLQLQVDTARSAAQSAKAQLEIAKRRDAAAQRHLHRVARLFAQQLVPEEEHAKAASERDVTRLEVEAAQALLGERKAELARLDFDRSALTIRAPFAGVVVGRYCQVGARVQALAPLVRIADLSSVYVRFAVPEEHPEPIRRGQSVWVRQAGDSELVEAHVEAVAPELDPTARVAIAQARVERVPTHWRMGAVLEVRSRAPAATQGDP